MKHDVLSTLLVVATLSVGLSVGTLAEPSKKKTNAAQSNVSKNSATGSGSATGENQASTSTARRNIRTGARIKVRAESVPAFRPGAGFKTSTPPSPQQAGQAGNKGQAASIQNTDSSAGENQASTSAKRRNIRTGASIKVKATSVPAFRAGAGFKTSTAANPQQAGQAPSIQNTDSATKHDSARRTSTKAGPNVRRRAYEYNHQYGLKLENTKKTKQPATETPKP